MERTVDRGSFAGGAAQEQDAGAIPLEPTLTAAGDSGRPCLLIHPDGSIAQAFSKLALRVLGPQQAG
jgi:hypothetical protein